MLTLSDIEKSTYSQNGEDGIIEYLLKFIHNPSKDFVEIGCATGDQNNTMALAEKGYYGYCFDAKARCVESLQEKCRDKGIANHVAAYIRKLTRTSAKDLAKKVPQYPDLFSIDIDSYDIHIVEILLGRGFRPKVIACEYNATFMDMPIAMPYNMVKSKAYDKRMYWGAGVNAYRKMLGAYDYDFVTVESAGSNAFFISKRFVDEDVLRGVKWLEWADSKWLLHVTKLDAKDRFARIRTRPYVEFTGRLGKNSKKKFKI